MSNPDDDAIVESQTTTPAKKTLGPMNYIATFKYTKQFMALVPDIVSVMVDPKNDYNGFLVMVEGDAETARKKLPVTTEEGYSVRVIGGCQVELF